jgi:hypothetical protein
MKCYQTDNDVAQMSDFTLRSSSNPQFALRHQRIVKNSERIESEYWSKTLYNGVLKDSTTMTNEVRMTAKDLVL